MIYFVLCLTSTNLVTFYFNRFALLHLRRTNLNTFLTRITTVRTTIATSISEMTISVQTAWKKNYPKAKRVTKKQWKSVKAKATPILRRQWTKFKRRPLDVQIAIVLSAMTAIVIVNATFFATVVNWIAITLWIIATIVAWAIVWREITGPVIVSCWEESLPIRRRFWTWVCMSLFSIKKSTLFNWGIVGAVGFGITFYISGVFSTFFASLAFAGLGPGLFLVWVEKHEKKCELRIKEAEALAKIPAKTTP